MKKVKIIITIAVIAAIVIIGTLPYTLPFLWEEWEKFQLDRVISSAPYNPGEYREGEFDCSNMAMRLGAWLEHHGYEIEIFLGESGKVGHVWLEVELQTTTVTVSAVQKKQVPANCYQEYGIVRIYNSTQELRKDWIERYGELITRLEWGKVPEEGISLGE